MSAWLVGVALVAATGAIAALASGEPRLGLVGLAASLVAAALLADPLPSPAVLGVRLTAALLAVAALRAALPSPGTTLRETAPAGPEPDGRSHLGWPAEVLLAAAGVAAGLAILGALPAFSPIVGDEIAPGGIGHGTTLDAAGLAFALAWGLLALALPALIAEPLGPRRAIAVVVATEAAILLPTGLAGPAGVAEEVVLAVLLAAVGAAAALLVAAARSAAPAGPSAAATGPTGTLPRS